MPTSVCMGEVRSLNDNIDSHNNQMLQPSSGRMCVYLHLRTYSNVIE